MKSKIGVIDFEHVLQPDTEPRWFRGISRYLPKNVDVLHPKTCQDIFDFLKKHQRLIVLDTQTPFVGEPMVYAEVTYWAQCTGEIPEEIIVLETKSHKEEAVAAEVCKYLH